VDLYNHSSIRLHGIVLTELRTGTTLPFYLFISDIPSKHTTQQEEAPITTKNTNVRVSNVEAQSASAAISTNSSKTPDDDQ
jgi:hypothetical protein